MEFGVAQRGRRPSFGPDPAPWVESMPNRRNTSEQVTNIEMIIKIMIMYVRPEIISLRLLMTRKSETGLLDIFLSAMESDKISARSRKTRHRSLRTCIRGLISRYSRTPTYNGCKVGSLSQKKLGTSSIFEAV